MNSGLDYIREYYGVPAKIGGRVRYTWPTPPREGTITGTRWPYLLIRVDGEKHSKSFHPTWQLEYLEAQP